MHIPEDVTVTTLSDGVCHGVRDHTKGLSIQARQPAVQRAVAFGDMQQIEGYGGRQAEMCGEQTSYPCLGSHRRGGRSRSRRRGSRTLLPHRVHALGRRCSHTLSPQQGRLHITPFIRAGRRQLTGLVVSCHGLLGCSMFEWLSSSNLAHAVGSSAMQDRNGDSSANRSCSRPLVIAARDKGNRFRHCPFCNTTKQPVTGWPSWSRNLSSAYDRTFKPARGAHSRRYSAACW